MNILFYFFSEFNWPFPSLSNLRVHFGSRPRKIELFFIYFFFSSPFVSISLIFFSPSSFNYFFLPNFSFYLWNYIYFPCLFFYIHHIVFQFLFNFRKCEGGWCGDKGNKRGVEKVSVCIGSNYTYIHVLRIVNSLSICIYTNAGNFGSLIT